ncbi:hypothetical protein ES703_120649 [subsurface metagenome]
MGAGAIGFDQSRFDLLWELETRRLDKNRLVMGAEAIGCETTCYGDQKGTELKRPDLLWELRGAEGS